MGTNASQLEKEIGLEFPANERFFGLANVSTFSYTLKRVRFTQFHALL